MSNPERQHFIPRSYLNNFADSENDKFFIHAKRSGSDRILRLSTKDICVDKNLYTIPTEDEKKCFDIEHFYADKIDSVFPEVFKLLKDKTVNSIGFETRLKIIAAALSLYFRTPKFLNIQNQLFENIVSKCLDLTKQEEVTVKIFDEEIIINRNETVQFIKERKEHNRIKFLFQHLADYEKFVQSKLKDNMAVYHIVDESEFITSDNPVIIRPYADPTQPDFDYEQYYRQQINPFDASNMIHLPLDKKTILTILPTTREHPSDYLQRMEIRKVDVLMYNFDIQKYSENWVLGSKRGIEEHIGDQQSYNEVNEKNIRMVKDYEEKTLLFKELLEVLKKYGAKSSEVRKKIEDLKKKPSISSDLNFQRIVKNIETE
jgi:hypothetical protein